MSTDYWVVNGLGLLIASILLFRFCRKTRDPFSFAVVFSLVWGANLVVSQFWVGELGRPSLEATIVLYLAWWLFLMGALFVRHPKQEVEAQVRTWRSPVAIGIMLALITLQWIAVIYEVRAQGLMLVDYFRTLVGEYPTLRLSGELRTVDLPWYLEIWRWSFAIYLPLAFLLHRKKALSTALLALVLLLAVLSTPLKVTRTPILHLAIIVFMSWIILYKPRRKLVVLVGTLGAGLLIVVFVLLQSSLILADPMGEWLTVSESVYSYIGGPAKAYDLLLRGFYPDPAGEFYSLDAVTFVLEKLQLIENRPSLVRSYVYVPYATNVYTFLDAFTLDLGVTGALLGSLFLGALVSFVFGSVWRAPNLLNLVAYTYFVYACAMTPMNNEFIRFSVPFTILLAWGANGLILKPPLKNQRRRRSITVRPYRSFQ